MHYEVHSIKRAAEPHWRDIALHIGEVPEQCLEVRASGKPKDCPCPLCGGRDRFQFKDRGEGHWVCRHCGGGDGFNLLMGMNRWSFPKALAEVKQWLRLPDEERPIPSPPQIKLTPPPQINEQVAALARNIWQASRAPDPLFPYLINKWVRACGIREITFTDLVHIHRKHKVPDRHFYYLTALQTNALLVIPVRDIRGGIQTLQFITSGGEKRMLAGNSPTGCFHRIGKPSDCIVIAEGYATAASLHEADRVAVAVAFFADNLKPVALALKNKYPNQQFIIAADNDRFKKVNMGIRKAKEAAIAIRGKVAIPNFRNYPDSKATDYNDLFLLQQYARIK